MDSIKQVIVFSALAVLVLLRVDQTTAESGEVSSSSGGSGTENCRDFTLAQFMALYTERRLTSPYIHIGVNLTIAEAQTKVSSFKNLLRAARHNGLKVLPKEKVCEGITSRQLPNFLNFTPHICPWSYQCDYNPRRFPSYLFHAKCDRRTAVVNKKIRNCNEVYYPVPVLISRGCNPITSKKDWVWSQEMVSIACVCST